MSKVKPVLGRGLASLIQRQPVTESSVSAGRDDDGVSTDVIVRVDLARVGRNPFQPREDFDPATLRELAESIREKGIIQPVTVRRHNGGYQLISGERRIRAAREAGLQQIPAYVVEVRSEEELLELALIENLQRENLNPIEIANSYRRLIEELGYTQEEVAGHTGKDRTTVTNFLRLLKLPDQIQDALRKGRLTGGHARALLAIEDRAAQLKAFRTIVAGDLTVRDAERMARVSSPKKGKRRGTASPRDGSYSDIESRLRHTLGTKVTVRRGGKGHGEIVIEYYSADDLQRLLELLESIQNA
jgi:ParB family chromosome partitioning protein